MQLNVIEAIGGTNGSADGLKVLEKIVHSLISSQFLPSISWTGRGKGNERKIALSKYINLMNAITVTACKADVNFTSDKSTHKLKYTILKHAPSKFGKPSSEISDKPNTDAQSEW